MSAAPPLPHRPVTQHDWREVVGLHWRVEPDRVAPLVPPGTRPDEHDGAAWASLVAYRFVDSTVPPLPRLGRLGTMTEIAVQLATVDDLGRQGVAYRSIDTQHLPAVLAARTIGLPYVWARAGSRVRADDVAHRTERHRGGAGSLVRVAPIDEAVAPTPALEFLTERWGVHAASSGRARWWRRAHEPWPLRTATATRLDDELLAAAGLPGLVDREPDLTTWSPGVVVQYSRG
ncbi:DUF2071 domain-containing protein [Frigoribacterium sp. ACAM 257]|uniref:YqjF family protein n=1 Tax=Frigoribacterium sp. ACAM 257 TaxID=2508998 RepID=UPI0011BA1E96|nr:DUF2071 domain-containing protein [Frigoribacterium sp. ACAM 257]TWX36196.1 DUF2071 domain-containing protein [Frigoribacterium sp. ACAM 257]